MPTEVTDRWTTKSVTIGAGVGNFGANIIGRVVDTPGLPGQWEGLGVGLTWHTPWSGQLTVGAENVVTRGKNPFAPGDGDKDEGTDSLRPLRAGPLGSAPPSAGADAPLQPFFASGPAPGPFRGALLTTQARLAVGCSGAPALCPLSPSGPAPEAIRGRLLTTL